MLKERLSLGGWAWILALSIGVTAPLVELMPIILGTGEAAIVDWSLTYVTLRYIALPAMAIINLLVIGAGLLRGMNRPLLAVLASIPMLYLVLLYSYPSFLFLPLLN